MITGASTASLAVVLVDARKGVLAQTRRHSFLVSLLGINRVALAVNKMDLIDYSQEVFERIIDEYSAFARTLKHLSFTSIPLSALKGDNVLVPSENMPWFRGPTLMGYLEAVPLDAPQDSAAFRLPVQYVNRPSPDFRGFCGTVSSGLISQGDRIRVQPSGRESRVARIVTADGDLRSAMAGQAITLTLEDEIDISRGNVLSRAEAPAEVADQFEATLVWMAEEPMFAGRRYALRLGTEAVSATITEIRYRVNVNTMEHVAARQLDLNEIGVCNIALDRVIAFDAYKVNPSMGGFILLDRLSNHTIGAGMLHFALRRAHNIHLQHVDVQKSARSALKGQRPCVLWFTGLSGAGKSTIANLVEKRLHAMGSHTYLLDGDNVRHGLNRDLGFTEADRVENIRRVAEVARLMVDAGLIVLTAFISPFRAERALARDLLDEGEFIEIHVDTPLDVLELRDVKGLYRKARKGELKNFTGIDSPYEVPEHPALRIRTTEVTADAAAEMVVAMLRNRGLV